MCGIAGYVVNRPGKIRASKLQSIAQNLLLELESRGKDATGYAYVSKRDKQVCIAKAPVEASDFVSIPGHLLSLDAPNVMPTVMILHTRYSTQGSPTDNRNNHPVYSKRSGMCIVHNGWLINDEALVKGHDLKKDAEVDTETYLRIIEKFYFAASKPRDVATAVAEAHKVAFGSMACGMIKGSMPGVLWLWRNSQGSLAIAEVDFGYVFASTPEALYKAIYRDCTARDVSFVRSGYVMSDTIIRITDSGEFHTAKLPTLRRSEVPTDLQGHLEFANQGDDVRWNRMKRQFGDEYCDGDYTYAGGYGYGYGYYRVRGNEVQTGTETVDKQNNDAAKAEATGKELVVLGNPGAGTEDTTPQVSTNSDSEEAARQAQVEAIYKFSDYN